MHRRDDQPHLENTTKETKDNVVEDPILGDVFHVRRTDHSYAIKQSETAEYFALLDARPPEERFFLCTDDPREEEMFQQRYPGRIQSYPKRDLDRRKPEAIEDALIDLLLLSRCTAVVASDGSLFSSCAAFIGNVLLHRVKS